MATGMVQIQEGFICADCRTQFSSAAQLLSHFNNEHSGSKSIVKDILDKAKKITTFNASSVPVNITGGYSASNFSEFGSTNNSLDYAQSQARLSVCPTYTDLLPLSSVSSSFDG